LRARRRARGASVDDVAGLRVERRYRARRSGTEHLHLRQEIDGISVLGGDISAAIDDEGRLLTLHDRTRAGLRGRVRSRRVRLDAEAAIHAAGEALGIEGTGEPVLLRRESGPERSSVHAPAGLSLDEIPARLAWVVDDDGVPQLAWSLVLRTPDHRHWWNVHISADDGSVLALADWIARDSYRVFPLPIESPQSGARTLIVDPADPNASPFGWHDTNGVVGAEFLDTRGNNVIAQEDLDADNMGGGRPSGGVGLIFDSPLDLSNQPANNLDAVVTQLFYMTNVVHDIFYQYGFDEAAGNFQIDNYGNGGLGNDPVRADVLDGSGVNNAQFGTPPDGLGAFMEMFRWLRPPTPHLVVTSPAGIANTYFAQGAAFGGSSSGLTGTVVQALDAADVAGPSATDGCSPLSNGPAVAGNLALVDRGDCTFVTKAVNAQAAGAVGVVIANNAGDGLVRMSGVDPTITIPVIFIGQSDAATIAAELGSGVAANLLSLDDRASSLDASIVVHEYAHGLTNRMVGGAVNVACLDALESAGMGEGWSDWFALALTADSNDVHDEARALSPWLLGQPSTGGGIRNAPYSNDLGTTPFTYADVATLNQPHGVGEVWAASLWRMYWHFVHVWKFDPDLHTGTGGNNRAIQLVVDALPLMACNPTMVGGRDALLLADLNTNAGASECLIWDAFARGGLGTGADDDGSASSLAVTEDFQLPAHCVPEPGVVAMGVPGLAWLTLLVRRRRRQGERNISSVCRD
jgi:hypothetical protein